MPDLALHPAPARPADKRTNTEEVDPAALRRVITAWCELAEAAGTPMRRKVAREIVLGHLRAGKTPEEVMRGARNAYGFLDPTGCTAAWLADRGGVR